VDGAEKRARAVARQQAYRQRQTLKRTAANNLLAQ
jgi:hypothetical protein